MNHNEEALRMIHKGIKAQEEARREELWRQIYGPPVLPEEYLNRPLGKMSEPLRKGVIVRVRDDMEKDGLQVTPAELARLVDLRLRKGDPKKNFDHRTIAAEIEATLDLIEHCQWKIGLRKAEWSQRASNWCQPYFESIVPIAEKEAIQRIEAQKYPVNFQKGLILMGVPGSPSKREVAVLSYFRAQWIVSAMWQHQYGPTLSVSAGNARSLDDFVEPPEAEFHNILEHYKRDGWPNATSLRMEREQWQRFKNRQTKEKRSKAGQLSGAMRKPKKAAAGRGGKRK